MGNRQEISLDDQLSEWLERMIRAGEFKNMNDAILKSVKATKQIYDVGHLEDVLKFVHPSFLEKRGGTRPQSL